MGMTNATAITTRRIRLSIEMAMTQAESTAYALERRNAVTRLARRNASKGI